MERQNFLDLAKGITIICIVIFHVSASTDPALYYYNYLVVPGRLLDSFIMPFFFIVSAAFSRKRLEKDNFSNIVFLKKISASILLPFYTLSLLFFIINIIAPESLGLPSPREMIKGLLYLQSKGDMMPSGVLWFLFVLFIFNLITFIALRSIKINIYILLILAVLLRTVVPYFHKELYYFAINLIAQYYIYYVVGYLLSEHIYKGHNISKTKLVISFFFCWTISLYFSSIVKYDFIYTFLRTFGISGICGSLFILGLSYKINSSFSPGIFSRFLVFCGANSIIIYVFHTPTFIIFKKIAYYLHLSKSFLGFMVTVLVGIFFPLLYGKILSYHAATYRLLLGRNP